MMLPTRKPPTKSQIAKARATAAKQAYEGMYARVLLSMLGLRGAINPTNLRPLTDVFAEAEKATNHLKNRCPSLFQGNNCGYLPVGGYAVPLE